MVGGPLLSSADDLCCVDVWADKANFGTPPDDGLTCSGTRVSVMAHPDKPATVTPGRIEPKGSPASWSDLNELDPALGDLFEEVTRRIQGGELVDVEEVAAEHPAWAESIRELLPALLGVARAGQAIASPVAPDGLDAEGRPRFGDFRIIRELGRGGMGIVYEAQQLSIARRVALKVISPAAALDARAIRRFQLEAQVAGLLQHPRIVPVYAVDNLGGVPYYAMQYVEGGSLAELIAELRILVDRGSAPGVDTPLADSCSALALGLLSGRFAPAGREAKGDRHVLVGGVPAEKAGTRVPPSIQGQPYIRTVARLGIQAAEALGYAHDEGVIHRDIKPANLLLDRRGELWVADFGMADVQGDAGLTATGDLPGTLRYMSPEQATGKRSLVDRRSDIYALGATLYELLTLQPAVAGSDKHEMLRRFTEEEPTPIRRLNPSIPVDLATIVTKTLSKDPTARYETASKLADDLERFLDGRPILARPVGPLARIWRWCRRKPVPAALAASLIVAVTVGFAGITWNWREAVRQKLEAERQKGFLVMAEQKATQQAAKAEAAEKRARTQAAKADAINRFLTEKLLRQAAPEHNPKARGVTLREALDRSAAEVKDTFKDHPETEAAILLSLGQIYHELGEYAKSEPHFRKAYEISRKMGPEFDADRLQAMTELGHILAHLERVDEGIPILLEASESSRKLLGVGHDISLMSSRYLAGLQRAKGRQAEAEALLKRVIEDARREGRESTCSESLNAMTELGVLLARQKRYPEAERMLRDSVELKGRSLGPDHPDTLANQHALASTLLSEGRPEEAEAIARRTLEKQRRVLGPEHPYTVRTFGLLADALLAQNRRDEAESLLRESLEIQRHALGPDDPVTVQTAKRLESLVKNPVKPDIAKTSPAPPHSRP